MLQFFRTNQCVGTLQLFSQTYLRGRSEKAEDFRSDFGDFSDLVTSVKIQGNERLKVKG